MLEEGRLGTQYGGPVWPLAQVARLHSALGDPAQAKAVLQEAHEKAGEQSFGLSPVWLGFAEAQLAAAEGNWEAAKQSWERCSEAAAKAGMRWHRARALWDWAEALIKETKGQAPTKARELLEEAKVEFEAMGAPIYTARIEARLKELAQLVS